MAALCVSGYISQVSEFLTSCQITYRQRSTAVLLLLQNFCFHPAYSKWAGNLETGFNLSNEKYLSINSLGGWSTVQNRLFGSDPNVWTVVNPEASYANIVKGPLAVAVKLALLPRKTWSWLHSTILILAIFIQISQWAFLEKFKWSHTLKPQMNEFAAMISRG